MWYQKLKQCRQIEAGCTSLFVFPFLNGCAAHMDQSKGPCVWLQSLPFLLLCQITQKCSITGQILPNTPNPKELWLGELVILYNGFTKPSFFFLLLLLLVMGYISAWPSMLLKESMFLPVFSLSVTIYALVLCPFSFARIPEAPSLLLFNNYLSGCKASFKGSTIATLFTKTRDVILHVKK